MPNQGRSGRRFKIKHLSDYIFPKLQNMVYNVIWTNFIHYRSFLISYAIFILTNTLFRLFPLTTPNLAFLELSDKNWSTIHKYWPTDEFLGSMESLKCVLSAKNVFELEKLIMCAGNEILQKKSVSLLNHYCSSLVNTKMLLATSKYHPTDLKFESVGQLFMRNGNFSRKWELFNFWHIEPP